MRRGRGAASAAWLVLSLLVPAAASSEAPGACEARDLYRAEVAFRLTQVQRYLADHPHAGFAYRRRPAAAAVEAVFAGPGTGCSGDWWPRAAAKALDRLERTSALNPAVGRDAWLQQTYDALALTLAFEAVSHEDQRAAVRLFQDLDEPRGRTEAVSVWSRIRASFRAELEDPHTAELEAPGPRPAAEASRAPAAPERSLVLAHQGGSRRGPPNSLAAFREARRLGADGIECDLRLSRDGEVFVLHDDRLEQADGGAVSVRASPAAKLRSLFLLDPLAYHRASSEHPLTLRELLGALGGKIWLWLELKPDGGEELARKVGDLLAEHPAVAGKVVVSSLAGRMVAPLRRRFPELRVAYESIEMDRATVEAFAASADAHRLILSVQHFTSRAPEAFRRARELRLRTSSFTPDRFDDLRRALEAGIDFIQTDRPDRALWLRERATATPGERAAREVP